MTLRAQLVERLQAAIAGLVEAGDLPGPAPEAALMLPKLEAHGDFTCTAALAWARAAKRPPRAVAAQLQTALGDAGGLLSKTELAGPGYLNLFVASAAWWTQLEAIWRAGPDFLKSAALRGERILLEYVSANPTGPLHVAHGRGAVVGDVLARLLAAAGAAVEREYYINDLGHQADIMARSVHWHYARLCGAERPKPEEFYPGDYLIPLAESLCADVGDRWRDAPEADWLVPVRTAGIAAMLARIRVDLAAFGIDFDRFVSERQLTEQAGLAAMLDQLQAAGHIYEEGGRRWFKSTAFGDDKDRVVVREDGRPTYFASDIAYHHDKMQRGYRRLINVWGADHAGYLARVKAGLTALGHPAAALEVIFIQMVSLSRGGEAVRMGKRLGTAVWLSDVVAEAGRDATRFFFLMRRADTQMDFDVELASQKSLDNPVYYAQMGHARLAAIARRAAAEGVPAPAWSSAAAAALTLPEELALIRAMAQTPDVVAAAAASREPHQLVHCLQALIAQFHSYYTQYKGSERVISADPLKTQGRLLLCAALQGLLRGILDLLGVEAPEAMSLDEGATP